MTSRCPTYELRVEGHLDPHWAAWLGDLALAHDEEGTSTLIGPVADQAALHGLLNKVRDLGVPLISVTPNPDHSSRVHAASPLAGSVQTARLSFRAATPADADVTWRYRRLPSVGEWLSEIPGDLAAYRSTFVDPERLAATVVVELAGRVIGDFMLRVEDAWSQAEIAETAKGAQAELGWVLDPRYTGQGYATEAVQALLRLCFRDLGVRRVVANCFLENDASWRLMERVGMRRETHAIEESLHRDGRWLDTVAYAMLAHEWSERVEPESAGSSTQIGSA